MCMQVVKRAYQQYLRNGLKNEIELTGLVVRDVELTKMQYLHGAITNSSTTVITTATTNIATKAKSIKVKTSRNVMGKLE